MFVAEYPVEGLTGAEYNPRKITAETEQLLRASIRECGFCKPVLVTEAGRLIAGHQRTNAARALGLSHVPAFVVKELELVHEMMFNQLHNGADVDSVPALVRVPPSSALGFVQVPPHAIVGEWRQAGASVRSEIYKLVARYGPWGCAIVTQSGEVLSSQQVALATKLANKALLVYVVPDERRELIIQYFSKEYGVFCYSKLPKESYIQQYAQPFRNRDKETEKIASKTYDMIRKRLRPDQRVLDFGCGFGQVLRELQRDGFDAVGIEFWYKGDSDSIKPAVVHQMVDDVCGSLATRGLFDIVVCDSVINSVDSVQAEEDVMTCLNAFCRMGGEIFFSGRGKYMMERALRSNRGAYTNAQQRTVEFLDEDGLSAIPQGGIWIYQKFHHREEAAMLAERFVGPKYRMRYGNAWQIAATKELEVPEEQKRAAIAREFDLPWPGGASVNRSEQALAAYAAARAIGA